MDTRGTSYSEVTTGAHRHYPVPNPFVNWWGGRSIEAAYQNLHAAEAAMAGLYDWDELEAEFPEAIARIEAGLQRDDPRRDAAHALDGLDRTTVTLDAARAKLTKAIEVGHAVADREHSRLRGFRNAVLASALVIGLLLLLFAAYVASNPEKVPICFTPPNAEGQPTTWVCPTGEFRWNSDFPTIHRPTSPHDVIVVILLGVLGGALSAAISIKGLTGSPTPYDGPLALAVLKVPLGALTALGALIALQGDFVPGLSELDSPGLCLGVRVRPKTPERPSGPQSQVVVGGCARKGEGRAVFRSTPTRACRHEAGRWADPTTTRLSTRDGPGRTLGQACHSIPASGLGNGHGCATSV